MMATRGSGRKFVSNDEMCGAEPAGRGDTPVMRVGPSRVSGGETVRLRSGSFRFVGRSEWGLTHGDAPAVLDNGELLFDLGRDCLKELHDAEAREPDPNPGHKCDQTLGSEGFPCVGIYLQFCMAGKKRRMMGWGPLLTVGTTGGVGAVRLSLGCATGPSGACFWFATCWI
jgi:hypothetical protein